MEKKKINIIKIGEIVPVPKDMNLRDTASFHRSVLNWQRSQEAKFEADCESKIMKKQEKEKSKVADPNYITTIVEDIFIRSWEQIYIRNKQKVEVKIQNHLEATKIRINKLARHARSGDLIVVPDIHVGTTEQEMTQEDYMTKEDRHTLAVNSLVNHILSDSGYKVFKQRREDSGLMITSVTKIERKQPKRFGIKVPQDNEKILVDEENNSKTYEELELEYQQNNEEIRIEWNKMMEERKKKEQIENEWEDKLEESKLNQEKDLEVQTGKDYNGNDICSSPHGVDMATNADKSDIQSSSHDNENTGDLHSSESNPDTHIAMETGDVVDSAPTPKTKTRKTWGSRIRGLFSCFSCSRRRRDD